MTARLCDPHALQRSVLIGCFGWVRQFVRVSFLWYFARVLDFVDCTGALHSFSQRLKYFLRSEEDMLISNSRLISMIAATLAATAVSAGEDGRTGPTPFTGPALDEALADMNTHLQSRYAQYDMLANLDAAPAQDFVVVAQATAETPLEIPEAEVTGFGVAIGGGQSLDLHLAAFNDDLQSQGSDLFLRVVRAEVTNFENIASDVKSGPSEFRGRVRDDPSLDARMSDLSLGLREFNQREERLNPAQPAVTGASFDQYGDSLKLLF